MSGQPQTDYDALAAQARKQSGSSALKKAPAALDYDALAAQARGTKSAPDVPSYSPPDLPSQEGFVSSASAPFVGAVKAMLPHSWKELLYRALPGGAQYDSIKNMLVMPAIDQGKQAL